MPLSDLIFEGVRVLALVAIPLTALMMLVGMLISLLQGALHIRDEALLYAVKLLVVIGLAYLSLNQVINLVLEFGRHAFTT